MSICPPPDQATVNPPEMVIDLTRECDQSFIDLTSVDDTFLQDCHVVTPPGTPPSSPSSPHWDDEQLALALRHAVTQLPPLHVPGPCLPDLQAQLRHQHPEDCDDIAALSAAQCEIHAASLLEDVEQLRELLHARAVLHRRLRRRRQRRKDLVADWFQPHRLPVPRPAFHLAAARNTPSLQTLYQYWAPRFAIDGVTAITDRDFPG